MTYINRQFLQTAGGLLFLNLVQNNIWLHTPVS